MALFFFTRWNNAATSWIWLLVFGGLVFLFAQLLVKTTTKLIRHSKVKAMFLSVVMVAFVTSAPELVTQITQGSQGRPTVAVANALGANSLSTLALVVVLLVFIRKTISLRINKTNMVNLLVVLGTTSLFTFALWRAPTQGIGVRNVLYIGIFPALFFLIYLAFVYFNHRFSDETSSLATPPSFSFEKTPASTRKTWTQFALVGVTLVFFSLCLNWAVDSSEKIYGLSQASSGGLILAVFNSLPEIVVVFQFVKQGFLQVGIGSIIGAQVFNVAQTFFADLAYPRGTITNGQDGSHLWFLGLSTTFMLLLFAVFYALGHFKKHRYYRTVLLVCAAFVYVGGWITIGVV